MLMRDRSKNAPMASPHPICPGVPTFTVESPMRKSVGSAGLIGGSGGSSVESGGGPGCVCANAITGDRRQQTTIRKEPKEPREPEQFTLEPRICLDTHQRVVRIQVVDVF